MTGLVAISETIYQEAGFLFLSILCGAGLIFAYDVLRIFRGIVVHSTAALAVEDLLYWLLVCGAVFYLLYEKNNGAVRIFFLLGVLSGMLFYNHFISPPVVNGVVWGLKKVIRVVQKLGNICMRPLRFCRKKTKTGAKIFLEKQKKIVRFYKKRLKKAYKVFKIGISKM